MSENAMQIKLLTSAALERILQHPESVWELLGSDMGLCTIMDLLELAEKSRKGRGVMSIDAFTYGWNELCRDNGALARGDIQIGVLDQSCLEDSLFEYDHVSDVPDLWSRIAMRDLPPDWAVRFLILRPSERSWWGTEPFLEMEARYSESVYVNS